MKMLNWLKEKSPTILSVLGGIGVIGTGVLTFYAVRESDRREEEWFEKNRGSDQPEPTLKERIQIEYLPYVPPAICAFASIACIFGANFLNKRQQAALMSAYALLEQSYREYKEKVRSLAGPATDEFIEKAIAQEHDDAKNDLPPWDEVQTFYLKEYGKFFDRTMQQVWEAEYHLNRNFVLRGYVTLNEFLDFLSLDHVEDGDRIGWDIHSGEEYYGYSWIDFSHRHYIADDGLQIYEIYLDFEPHELFGDLSYVSPTMQTLKD